MAKDNPSTEDRAKAHKTVTEMIEFLGLDTENKNGGAKAPNATPYNNGGATPYENEQFRRGIPVEAMQMINLQIGQLIVFDEIDGTMTNDYHLPRQRKTIRGYVTGIFVDGFAFVPAGEHDGPKSNEGFV